ncbi:hypothetical protein Pelo_17172 [Pelomyxa schiedti]|nr:hypothetical protein Pelo_17172 [Pelomyxa schiedti]
MDTDRALVPPRSPETSQLGIDRALGVSWITWRIVLPRLFPSRSCTGKPPAPIIAFCGCPTPSVHSNQWHDEDVYGSDEVPQQSAATSTTGRTKKPARVWPVGRLWEHMRHYEGACEEIVCKCGEAMFPLRALMGAALIRQLGNPFNAACAAATHNCIRLAGWISRRLDPEDHIMYSRYYPGPISFAVGHGHADFAEWFSHNHGMPLSLDTEHGNARNCAYLGGNLECVELFDRNHNSDAVIFACKSGSFPVFKYAMNNTGALQTATYFKALKTAASVGSLEICAALIKRHVLTAAFHLGDESKVAVLQNLLGISSLSELYFAPELAVNACKSNGISLLQRIIQNRANSEYECLGMIKAALKYNNLEAARLVINVGIPSIRDHLWEIIYECCTTDNVEGVQWLVTTLAIREHEIPRTLLITALLLGHEIRTKVPGAANFTLEPPKFLVANYLASIFQWNTEEIAHIIEGCCCCVPAIDWFFNKFDLNSLFANSCGEFLSRVLKLVPVGPSPRLYKMYWQVVQLLVDWIAPKFTLDQVTTIIMESREDLCPVGFKAMTKHFDLKELSLGELLEVAAKYDVQYQKKIGPGNSLVYWYLQYFSNISEFHLTSMWAELLSLPGRNGCMNLLPAVHDLVPLSREYDFPARVDQFQACVQIGNFRQAMWMADTLRITKADLRSKFIVDLCTSSALEPLKWLCERFSITKADTLLIQPDKVIRAMGVRGQYTEDTAMWFIQHFRITPRDLSGKSSKNLPVWLKDIIWEPGLPPNVSQRTGSPIKKKNRLG